MTCYMALVLIKKKGKHCCKNDGGFRAVIKFVKKGNKKNYIRVETQHPSQLVHITMCLYFFLVFVFVTVLSYLKSIFIVFVFIIAVEQIQ